MKRNNPIFEQTGKQYLAEIARIDFRQIEAGLGISVRNGSAVIPFLGTDYLVSAEAVIGPERKAPPPAVSVILCKYLLLCPDSAPPEASWVSFRDFRNAAPLVASFANTAEGALVREFAGRVADLQRAAQALGGRGPTESYDYDVSLVIPALPRVPLLLLFNGADEGFPAACSMLFERRAERYLDMECLAMVGMLLADRLRKIAA
jgi:hypothetical protein